jgi:deferrochelatase/peroxidase EfeB
VAQVDPKLPPPDSGILGPIVTPDNLTITVSVGESLFDERFGLAAAKPKRLIRMVGFPNDALEADCCHGDLSLQFCSNTTDTNIHALRDIVKNLPDLLLVRWKQEGSVPPGPGQTGCAGAERAQLPRFP